MMAVLVFTLTVEYDPDVIDAVSVSEVVESSTGDIYMDGINEVQYTEA
jgi:hypothetical protein